MRWGSGQKMKQLAPNTEASAKKHTAIVIVEGNTVKVNVGSVDHSMTDEHSIATENLNVTAEIYDDNNFVKLQEKHRVIIMLCLVVNEGGFIR